MPLYEYRCSDCNNQFELLRKAIHADEVAFCPVCQSEHTARMMSLVNAFIGSGAERKSISGGCSSCTSAHSHACGSCHR